MLASPRSPVRRLALATIAGLLATGGLLAATAGPAAAATHVVKSGDTLGGIALKYKCSTDAIRRANKLRGDLIRIGQSLDIPEDCGAPPGAVGEVITHHVLPGETMSEIAERYGVTVQHIMDMNRRSVTKRGLIRAGQKLRVRPTKPARPLRRVRYKIEAGDTLGRIAERYELSVRDIMRMNPRKDPKKLRIGDTIEMWIEGPEVRSSAAGRPQAGVLINGEQLPPGPAWYRRRPERSWGTNETVALLVDAFTEVRRQFPKAHDIAVGDLSAKNGGRLAKHVSHQSGRDADIGYYFLRQPKHGPKAFISALRHPLDYEATWALLMALVGSSPDKSRVEYMFISYPVQKKLYDWAKKAGKSERVLDWLFQYPRGQRSMNGIIRHEPGHSGHIHIRFKCPRGDKDCR